MCWVSLTKLQWQTALGSTISYLVLEMCLLKVSLLLVWKVQMPSPNKVKVFLAFASRLLYVRLGLSLP